jgi:hypothetical protein
VKSPYRGNRCHLCGRECVRAVDKFGTPYMGCPVCSVADFVAAVKPVERAAKSDSGAK